MQVEAEIIVLRGRAIVGGVAAAGTVTGLGITGSLPGQGSSSPRTSR